MTKLIDAFRELNISRKKREELQKAWYENIKKGRYNCRKV
jgi:hypothetical protein